MSATPVDADQLQFEPAAPLPNPGAEASAQTVTCTSCQGAIAVDYFDLRGQPVCRACRVRLIAEAEPPKGVGAFVRAGAFGVAAAIAGAALYYAVIAITKYEIGLVAIAIGYMVGYAVRAGARGRGGRRLQVLAVVLTYVSVSWAYSVLALTGSADEPGRSAQAITKGSGAAGPAPTSGTSRVEAQPADQEVGGGAALVSLVFLLGFSLALPVIVTFGSLPGGVISAAIIVFGMQQAWRMTAAPVPEFLGPYRVGAGGADAVS